MRCQLLLMRCWSCADVGSHVQADEQTVCADTSELALISTAPCQRVAHRTSMEELHAKRRVALHGWRLATQLDELKADGLGQDGRGALTLRDRLGKVQLDLPRGPAERCIPATVRQGGKSEAAGRQRQGWRQQWQWRQRQQPHHNFLFLAEPPALKV